MNRKNLLLAFSICVLTMIFTVCFPVSAETTYEVGKTYQLYTAANYGTNKWVSGNTGIVQVVSYGGQYCTIKCLRTGSTYVKIYVYYKKPVYNPVTHLIEWWDYIDDYYTYTINVRSPQCVLANTSSTKTTASFSFDAPTGATSVQLMQSTNSGVTWTKAAAGTLNSSSTSAVASGLTANTSYSFKLSVVGGARNGDSNSINVTTKAYVTGVSVSNATLTIMRGKTANLSATVSPQNAENKIVGWTSSNSKLATVTTNSDGSATITANQTTNGTLKITAKTIEGGYSASCNVTIIDPPPSFPTNFRATEIGDTNITLEWDPVKGAQFYYVYINDVKRTPLIKDTKYTFTDMTPGGENLFYATAGNQAGESVYSLMHYYTQKNVFAQITPVSTTDTTITINWKYLSTYTGRNMIKTIDYRVLGSSTWSEIYSFSSADTITYTGFSPNTAYEIIAFPSQFDSDMITVKTYTSGVTEGVKKPVASIESGSVDNGTEVSLSTETDGAVIYYTTDGTAPTTSSTVYTGPIEINDNVTIKAFAVKTGLGDSVVTVCNYKVNAYISSITTDKPGPQVTGTTIRWSCNAKGVTDPVYYYKIYKGSTVVTESSDYSTINYFDWTPTEVGTDYRALVYVKENGASYTTRVSKYSNYFTISAPAPIAITSILPDKASPQPTGTKIRWSCTVSGGKAPVYYYKIYKGSTVVAQSSDYSTSNYFDWTPTETGTDYRALVYAKENGASYTTRVSKYSSYFTVSASAPIAITSILPDKASPQLTGTNIRWTCTVSGGKAPVYYFRIYKGSTVVTESSDYSTNKYFDWTPTEAGTDYRALVYVKENGASYTTRLSKYSSYFTIAAPIAISSLTPDNESPQLTGTNIRWTCTVSGGKAPVYYFRIYKGSTVVTESSDYSTNSYFDWTPAEAGTDYRALVYVKENGASYTTRLSKYSSYFTVTAPTLKVMETPGPDTTDPGLGAIHVVDIPLVK